MSNDELKFSKIQAIFRSFGGRKNDTPEKQFEYQIYSILNDLLSLLDAFESGRRNPLDRSGYPELLAQLERTYNLTKQNIEYLEQRIRARTCKHGDLEIKKLFEEDEQNEDILIPVIQATCKNCGSIEELSEEEAKKRNLV